MVPFLMNNNSLKNFGKQLNNNKIVNNFRSIELYLKCVVQCHSYRLYRVQNNIKNNNILIPIYYIHIKQKEKITLRCLNI